VGRPAQGSAFRKVTCGLPHFWVDIRARSPTCALTRRVLFMNNIVYLENAKNFASVRYAYVWCQRLASWDPDMRSDTDMEELYFDYAARARHFGHITKKFQLDGDVIQPVNFEVWYEIFCHVYGGVLDIGGKYG
jgi:hypothetical protein